MNGSESKFKRFLNTEDYIVHPSRSEIKPSYWYQPWESIPLTCGGFRRVQGLPKPSRQLRIQYARFWWKDCVEICLTADKLANPLDQPESTTRTASLVYCPCLSISSTFSAGIDL